jgi:toxin ParE1/3/4
MAEVIWTEPALAQFEAILDYLALDRPAAARAVAASTVHAVALLGRFLRMGRPIPEFPHRSYRQVWIKPCWFYYRHGKSAVVILHVRRAEKPLSLADLLNEAD